jgi:hypothetical protein
MKPSTQAASIPKTEVVDTKLNIPKVAFVEDKTATGTDGELKGIPTLADDCAEESTVTTTTTTTTLPHVSGTGQAAETTVTTVITTTVVTRTLSQAPESCTLAVER